MMDKGYFTYFMRERILAKYWNFSTVTKKASHPYSALFQKLKGISAWRPYMF